MEKNLFSLIPDAEREVLDRAFSCLSSGSLEESVKRFGSICDGTYSNYTKSFANYGIAVTHMQSPSGSEETKDIDIPIFYLRRSIQVLQHADSYLLFGYALEKKICNLIQENVQRRIFNYSEIQSLLNEAMESFSRASQLNASYAKDCSSRLEELKKIEKDMQKRQAELN